MERLQKYDPTATVEFECDPLGYAETWRKRTDKAGLSPWYSEREDAYFDHPKLKYVRTAKKQVLRRITGVFYRYRTSASRLAIEGLFNVRNREEVGVFFRENRFLITLAIEARIAIKRHFPEAQLFLEVLKDAEGIDPDILYLYVSTDLSPTDARPKLKALDNDWWIAALDRARGKLCISLEYQ